MATRSQPPSTDGTEAPQDVPPQDAPAQDAPVEAPKAPVNEDITSLPGALQAVRPPDPVEDLDGDADYVEYKGRATSRRITAEQWEKARVKDQGEVLWDASNGFKVPLADLNQAALTVLRRDGGFAIPEGK